MRVEMRATASRMISTADRGTLPLVDALAEQRVIHVDDGHDATGAGLRFPRDPAGTGPIHFSWCVHAISRAK